MNKAFLSHSSKDKNLVREVFRFLGPTLAEIDEFTFEAGLPNWKVISSAFDRCSVFVLFASEHAAASGWVDREAREAIRRLKNGQIRQILVILPKFSDLEVAVPPDLYDYAVLTGLKKAKPIERAIRRKLIDVSTRDRRGTQISGAFVGRDLELRDLKHQLLDPEKSITSVVVSGRDFMGRSALIERALTDLDPSMFVAHSILELNPYDSCTNLAIQLHGLANEYISADEISAISSSFESDEIDLCVDNVIRYVSALRDNRQYVIITDRGGILAHDGSFSPICQRLIQSSKVLGFPAILLTTRRRVRHRARLSQPNAAFIDLEPLEPTSSQQYVVHRLRSAGISLSGYEIEEITKRGMGVPRTYDYIIEKCKTLPIDIVLTDQLDIIDYNHESSQSYLGSIKLSAGARHILKILRLYPKIPAEFIHSLAIENNSSLADLVDSLSELLDWHVIYQNDGVYSISDSLVSAIDRDLSLALSDDDESLLAKKVITILREYSDEGKIPVSAVDAVGLASINSETNDNWSRAFVLPSHYIYLGRKYYDRKKYDQSVECLRRALDNTSVLSDSAILQAARYLGMAAARKSDSQSDMTKALSIIGSLKDEKSAAWASFIRGFKCRLDGQAEEALQNYTDAELVLSSEFVLCRELALTHLMLANFDRALSYGKEALVRAPDNPYLLDIVIRALSNISGRRPSMEVQMELQDYYRRLKDVGSRGSSFYQVRMAEKSLREGNLHEAEAFADDAVLMSPDLAAVYLTRARIKMSVNKTKEARDDIKIAKEKRQAASFRVDYFEAQIDRVEVEFNIKLQRWDSAIIGVERMASSGRPGIVPLVNEIKNGIRYDRRNHSQRVMDFMARY